ncbi:MAG: hypothetical protein JSU01_13515 [Bacteroidetes bacterium]|nr:hypothetical protein [Bacteroidota bacterium]
MDMQDNEFDGLFRNKLNGFESEPSDRVWHGIGTELDKKKIAILPWLSIAASIIVLVSAGILLIPRGQKANHSGEGVVKLQPKPTVHKPVEQVAATVAPAIINQRAKHERRINTKKGESAVIAATHVKPNEAITKSETSKIVDQPVIAAVVTPKTDQVKQPVVPGSETQLIAKQNVDSTISISKPVLVAKAQPETKSETPVVKKHGIRNFGELVNLVVAKVDKRKDKAVQFTDDEDGDGATLTAVNIGPVKFGKDEK